jgi:hypothetical protein
MRACLTQLQSSKGDFTNTANIISEYDFFKGPYGVIDQVRKQLGKRWFRNVTLKSCFLG